MLFDKLRGNTDNVVSGGTDHTPCLVTDDDGGGSHSEDDTNDTLSDDESDDILRDGERESSQQMDPDPKIHEQYQMMIKMTLELVRNMTIVKKDDEVLTPYGNGILLKRSGDCGSMEIQLPFGKLYHRKPEMLHKDVSPKDYEEAMEHLEQVRQLGLTAQGQQWNVDIIDEVCVACLFDKPYCNNNGGGNDKIASQNAKRISKEEAIKKSKRNRRHWLNRFSSASTSTVVSRSRVAAPLAKESDGTLTKKRKTTRTKFCDVCGNPVCSKHITPAAGGNQFRMCVDCEFDFTRMFETTSANKMTQSGINSNLLDLDHIPHLTQTLDRLLTYYTRMVLNLTFCAPNLRELAERLTYNERTNTKINLGTGGISFVGAALGVAGTAALLTPAGPALLLAACSTSASSAAIQGGQAGYNALFNTNLKEANQLTDRVVGWHGLCVRILDALEQLRRTLVKQILSISKKDRNRGNSADNSETNEMSAKRTKQEEKDALLLRQVLNSRSNVSGSDGDHKSVSEQSLDVLNTVAMGTYVTTRNGLTGVGLTAQMGASYSQMINASIQTVPVVGGAFSLGCMAMDMSNIASTLNKLQKPSAKAVALHKIEASFFSQIPATIQYEVEALLGAVNTLKERQEEAQTTQQQDLIEQELEELNII
mmetsp:Transcript_9344/g.22952  ORF Transcript_9344/g.22952 Transcript_9344/m.22952 type:complete len:651 (+) Transcript_9344:176-2128(+)